MRLSIEVKKEKSNLMLIFVIVGAILGLVIGTITFPGGGSIVGILAGAILGGATKAIATGVVAVAVKAVIAIFTLIAGGALGGGVGIAKDELTKLHFISGELIIPNITSVDARYINGTKITSLKDEISGVTTYPFQIPISLEEKELKKQESLIFQFIPNKESEISVDLIFDDNIAEQYDRVNTIIFVK